MTPKEQVKEDRRLVKTVDAVFNKFMKKFRLSWNIPKPGQPAPDRAVAWKWRSWDLMTRIGEYIEKNPEIKTIQVSDRDHSISELVIIPHYDAQTKWSMGISVVHVPQNLDEIPQIFFVRDGPFATFLTSCNEGDF